MGVEVKICGITNRDDAMAALEYGADYLGFVLYKPSKRGITPIGMAKILDCIDAPYKAVGVFVNTSRSDVEKIALDCNLHAVQLHGDELVSDFDDITAPVWRSVCIDDNTKNVMDDWGAVRYVVDAVVPGLYGGTGVTADWDLAAKFAKDYPIMLAGGLTPCNIADGIRKVRPLGVDTASGVEAVPGKKDLVKMREFIKIAKQDIEI